ncbi:hypothetical protein NECAME_10501 [Necator americanus]|uniref:Uncharacterized protein n=1 Tax=Necator americanus TaxID=51031 RepID=W2TAF9_NECAM|nr:hypothetical protein NECAME_10501 [Necator americanus]ETN78181.1 hypothetical protein NECAME_10501 [Necator americanus]
MKQHLHLRQFPLIACYRLSKQRDFISGYSGYLAYLKYKEVNSSMISTGSIFTCRNRLRDGSRKE